LATLFNAKPGFYAVQGMWSCKKSKIESQVASNQPILEVLPAAGGQSAQELLFMPVFRLHLKRISNSGGTTGASSISGGRLKSQPKEMSDGML
jgi:hypothetical protein